MSSSRAEGPSLPVGIPRELDSRSKHLFKLLENLPTSIPLDPADDVSTYHFYLDSDNTHLLRGGKLLFKEHGKRIDMLQVFIKQNVKENSLPEQWIPGLRSRPRDVERNILTMIHHPNLFPTEPKRIKASTDNTEPSAPPPAPSTSLSVVSTNAKASEDSTAPRPELQQGTLFQFGARKFTATEMETQQRKHAAEAKEKCLAAAEREKRLKENSLEKRCHATHAGFTSALRAAFPRHPRTSQVRDGRLQLSIAFAPDTLAAVDVDVTVSDSTDSTTRFHIRLTFSFLFH
ncbi:hypothetical protein C8F04DRAFT_1278519 [Mycena alexandri]|uniref:Uncharacterized protein n=1 Tax=Mycena alexandri TaxID=1745969 RepID=A0AAD6RZC1_9AGAR|nr:hypothetical protein C8F04DRAFT_1278519 [Mycena alexandri]